MIGDADLAALKKGDIVQLQRKGFFICDEPLGVRRLVWVNCILLYLNDDR